MIVRSNKHVFFGTALLVACVLSWWLWSTPQVYAEENVDELRQLIEDRHEQLREIEEEIKKFEAQLDEVGRDKQSLQNTINTLDISRKKILTDIRATETKIGATDLEIRELDREITIKELQIGRDTDAIVMSFQTVDELEDTTLLETLLNHDSLAEVWDSIEEQTQFQESLRDDIRALGALKNEYMIAKDKLLGKKGELSTLKDELSGEKSALDQTRDQKNDLLEVTQNKEVNYQMILAEKKAARDKFEQELRAYESQLQFALDRSTIPPVGSGVLAWPFEPGYMTGCLAYENALGNKQCLTQYFGNTQFAQSGAYNGNGHNGIDFRTPIGTKILAALSGLVVGTGNTDAVSGCYSYGKWVLVEHANGLSSLYAHLSSIGVSEGQQLTTGQLVGYSGNTGYTTGPHLHFGLYASAGVKVQKLGDIPGRPITGCSPVAIPIAGFEAYLNPLDYL